MTNKNPNNIPSYTVDDTIQYSEEYDAYYNSSTNEWTESKCSDNTCDYCADRPERPL